MLKVGITGNIGSGKTTVSKIFEVFGVPVYYADEAAKRLMIEDPALIGEVKKLFGEDAYFGDGALNRKFIAGKVFNNEYELKKLNMAVHPAVFRDFDVWTTARANFPYVIKEAAILFESGSYKFCDQSVIVTAPLELRIQRITKRDNITAEEALARENRQMPEKEKIKLADHVITNDDTQMVIPQVMALHHKFTELAGAR